MFNNRTRFGAIQTQIDGGPGPPATLVREPGQIRKEAATADDVCRDVAGVSAHLTF